MSWLRESDWQVLQQAPNYLYGIAGAFVAYLLWRRFRHGERVLSRENAKRWLTSAAPIIAFLALMVGQQIIEKRGYGLIAELLFIAAMFAPFGFFAHFQMLRARKAAVANPGASPRPLPKVAPSHEETKVNNTLLTAITVFGLFACGGATLLVYLSIGKNFINIPMLVVAFFYCAAILGVMIYGTLGRWPGRIAMKGSIEINATPQEIWNVVRFRNTTHWWKKIVSRVERTDAPGETYKIHYFNNSTCGKCGLPHDPDSKGRTNSVHILESNEPYYLSWRAAPDEARGVLGKMMSHEEQQFRLEVLPGGKTKVTSIGFAEKPHMVLALILKLGDPAGEELRTLKYHIEGVQDGTLYEVGAKRIDEARHAPKFCGCPAGTATAGLF